MTERTQCACVGRGRELLTHKGEWILSSHFFPSCDSCTACICCPVIMDLEVEDRWRYFVACNIGCDFCYTGHPDRTIIIDTTPIGTAPEDIMSITDLEADLFIEGSINGEPETLVVVYGTAAKSDESGASKKKLKRLRTRYIKKLKEIWAKESSGNGVLKGMTRTLTYNTARKGKYMARYKE